MNQAQAKKLVIVNLAFWFVAMLLHPVTRMLPTGSGSPPKIFEFLIPVFFIMLAGGSTYLLRAAIGKPKDEQGPR
ncbi:MAG: hypothetical protein ACOYOF_16930 [Verrucomicrobiaceae bacterium]